jgi:hypothetical protein
MTASGSVDRLSQRYSLGGIIPPLAPYAGTFNGPGPLISANPASTTVSRVPASAAFSAKVDGLLYGFKLGPFVEAPLAKRVSLDLSGGLAAMCAEADFTFTETIGVSAPGGSPAPRTGEAKNSEWLLGFYGNCRLSVALSDSTSVFVGGQYVHLGDVSAGTGGKLATLKAGSTYEVLAGVKFTF